MTIEKNTDASADFTIDTISIDTINDYNLPQISSLDIQNTVLGSPYGTWNTALGNNVGNITISSSPSTFSWSTTAQSSLYTVGGANGTSGLHVTSDATFEGDIKWKGKSLGDMIEKIHQRLAILTPDLEKLEHFSALKKAYDNYKMLEALCEVPKKEEDEH